jgi:hypothetical protein
MSKTTCLDILKYPSELHLYSENEAATLDGIQVFKYSSFIPWACDLSASLYSTKTFTYKGKNTDSDSLVDLISKHSKCHNFWTDEDNCIWKVVGKPKLIYAM